MKFELMKGKLKNISDKWEKYLEGKTLILCTGSEDALYLCGIESEESLDTLCEYAWNTELEHEYESIDNFKEEVSMGNDGFGFYKEQIEILEIVGMR